MAQIEKIQQCAASSSSAWRTALVVRISGSESPAWKIDLVFGDHFVGGSSSLAAISGYPEIPVSQIPRPSRERLSRYAVRVRRHVANAGHVHRFGCAFPGGFKSLD